MKSQSGRLRTALLTALIVGLVAQPELLAHGSRGGHSSAHVSHARPPHVTVAHRSGMTPPRPVRMPRAATPSHAKVVKAPTTAAKTTTGTGTGRTHATTSAASAGVTTGHPSSTTYAYGQGRSTRHYQARGYGRGYRNSYYGGRRGYGYGQGSSRAIVSRLRSVHSTLARIDHDYQGHRARAMHSISMAIRQLSHRSMYYRRSNASLGMNNFGGNRRFAGNGGVGRQRMSQVQSDTRMGQALRTTQGIQMQLSHQGTNSTTHARARGHVQVAIQEMGTALSVR